MRKSANMKPETEAKIKDNFEEIYDIYYDAYSKFWEVKGTMGGDIRCMRFYDSGMVTER